MDVAGYVAAVDPTNADRVYVRTRGASRLLVTGDAGQTFSVAVRFGGPMLGFAASPDGLRAYAGGPDDGLYAVPRDGVPVRVSDGRVQCLAVVGGDLWECTDGSNGLLAGVSSDDGASFTARLRSQDIVGPIACPGDAAAAQCTGMAFQQLCGMIGGCAADPPPATGSATYDAAAVAVRDAGLTTPMHVDVPSACGCSAVGNAAGAAPVPLAGGASLGVVVWAKRRRSRAAR
jgi:hypothetical protein